MRFEVLRHIFFCLQIFPARDPIDEQHALQGIHHAMDNHSVKALTVTNLVEVLSVPNPSSLLLSVRSGLRQHLRSHRLINVIRDHRTFDLE